MSLVTDDLEWNSSVVGSVVHDLGEVGKVIRLVNNVIDIQIALVRHRLFAGHQAEVGDMAFSEEDAGTIYIVPNVSEGEAQLGRIGHCQRAVHGCKGVPRIVHGNFGSEATRRRGYEGVDFHAREVV